MSRNRSNGKPAAAPLPPERIRALFPTYANLELDAEGLRALGPHEQGDLLARLDYRQKYQLLERSEHMPELVRSLSAEDLFFTIEAAGRTDAMELVMAAKPAQLMRVFDISCWERDRFDEGELLDWFAYMVQTDPEEAFAKIAELDLELVMLMLARYIKVYRVDWHELDKLESDLDLSTLDDYYHFTFLDGEDKRHERLTVFLKTLYKMNHPLYMELMEGLLWEMPSNVEESNYRGRSDRMANHGYPDYLDAIGLFARNDPAALKAKLNKIDATPKPFGEEEERRLPVYYGNIIEEDSFFSRALLRLDDEQRQTLKMELVYLSNRAIVARQALDDIERLKAALKETHGMLALGLEYVSDGDVAHAAELLQKAPMFELYQAGFALVRRLHRRALAFHAKHIEPFGRAALTLVSSPGRELLNALMRQPAQYYLGATPGSREMHVRPFMEVAEVERAELLITRMEFLFDLHFSVLAIDPKATLASGHAIALDPMDPDLRLIKIYFTAFANARMGREADYRPIEPEAFEQLLADWLVEREDGTGLRVRDGLADDVRRWTEQYVQNKDADYRYLAEQWAVRCVQVLDGLAARIKTASYRGALSLSQVLLLG